MSLFFRWIKGLAALFAASILLSSCESSRPQKEKLIIVEKGETEYVIVPPENPSVIDKWAVSELSKFLNQSTGAVFTIESQDKIADKKKRIFVGLSTPSIALLGKDPLAGMENQEHVCKNIGSDIFLFGQGTHGNLYAVYEFLENSIGIRWYSPYEKAMIPFRPDLILSGFHRQTRYAFPYRDMYTGPYLLRKESMQFLYRNRLNMSLEFWRDGLNQFPGCEGILNEVKLIPPTVHTLFAYVPPQEAKAPGANPPLAFLKNKNYFTSNPEYFSMDASGNRTNLLQLCFANKGLRQTLTENVLEHVKINGGKGIVTVDANDRPGHFCYCEECRRLEDKYASPGGPLFDYLLELSAVLQKQYPEVFVKFVAYRKDQTQKPPRIEKLPDNLIPFFAPIDDNFAADWEHPSNHETGDDLRKWCSMAKNVWVWYYPNPFMKGGNGQPPFGNIGRFVNDLRTMKSIGVRAVYWQHGSFNELLGLGFTELRSYLALKLMQNPEQDVKALIEEFTDYHYGCAAEAMRQYLNELEQYRKDINTFIQWSPSYGAFRYLTAENLYRWEQAFDKMDIMTTDTPRQNFNVQTARIDLDIAVLEKWKELKHVYPGYFTDPKQLEKRFYSTYEKAEKERCSSNMIVFLKRMFTPVKNNLDSTMIFAENEGKPLPEIFAAISKERICRVVPNHMHNGRVKDTDAAFGIAAESVPANPFTFGFYDGNGKKFVLQSELRLQEINASGYQFYKLGSAELTPDCLLWFADWNVTAKLEQFYEPGGKNEWDMYVSLKFEGPMYSGDAAASNTNRVFIDQIILVKKE